MSKDNTRSQLFCTCANGENCAPNYCGSGTHDITYDNSFSFPFVIPVGPDNKDAIGLEQISLYGICDLSGGFRLEVRDGLANNSNILGFWEYDESNSICFGDEYPLFVMDDQCVYLFSNNTYWLRLSVTTPQSMLSIYVSAEDNYEYYTSNDQGNSWTERSGPTVGLEVRSEWTYQSLIEDPFIGGQGSSVNNYVNWTYQCPGLENSWDDCNFPNANWNTDPQYDGYLPQPSTDPYVPNGGTITPLSDKFLGNIQMWYFGNPG